VDLQKEGFPPKMTVINIFLLILVSRTPLLSFTFPKVSGKRHFHPLTPGERNSPAGAKIISPVCRLKIQYADLCPSQGAAADSSWSPAGILKHNTAGCFAYFPQFVHNIFSIIFAIPYKNGQGRPCVCRRNSHH
jgi:hypothetical protein